MKKALVIAMGGVVIGAGVWGALWYAGQSRITDRLDYEVARLERQGYEIAFARREVEGFPVGYRVVYHDLTVAPPETGLKAVFPTMSGEVSVDAPDTLVLTPPETFEVLIERSGGPAEQSSAEPSPGPLRLEVEAETPSVVIRRPPGTAEEVRASAASLLLVSATDDKSESLALELVNLKSTITLPAGTEDARGLLEVGKIDLLATAAVSDGPRNTVSTTVNDLRMTATASSREGREIVETLRGGGKGRLELRLDTGQTESALSVDGGQPELDGTLRTIAGSSSAAIEIDGNTVTISNLTQGSKIMIDPASEAASLPGVLEIGTLDLIYTAPIAPSETMSPLGLKLAAIAVAPDAALWSRLDPDEVLVRDPLKLFINVEGTARLTKDPSDMRPGEAPPIAFGNVLVREVQLTGLGAEITGAGDMEFVPPLLTPKGSIRLEMTAVMPAVEALQKAGWLDDPTADYLRLLADAFTRPGEAPDQLVSVIDLDPQGILINGMPIQ